MLLVREDYSTSSNESPSRFIYSCLCILFCGLYFLRDILGVNVSSQTQIVKNIKFFVLSQLGFIPCVELLRS